MKNRMQILHHLISFTNMLIIWLRYEFALFGGKHDEAINRHVDLLPDKPGLEKAHMLV